MFASCPISGESRNERVVRIVAGIVVAISLTAFALGARLAPLLLVALGLDFAIRGFGSPTCSPLAAVGRGIARTLRLAPRPVDAAPKKFAARIGVVFTATAAALLGLGASAAGWTVLGILVACASLEALAGLCVGCKVYALLPRPLAVVLTR